MTVAADPGRRARFIGFPVVVTPGNIARFTRDGNSQGQGGKLVEGHKESGAGQLATSIGSTPVTSTGLIGAEQAVRMDCLQLAVQLDRDGSDTGATIDRARAFADFVLKGSTSPAQPLIAGLDVQAGGVELQLHRGVQALDDAMGMLPRRSPGANL